MSQFPEHIQDKIIAHLSAGLGVEDIAVKHGFSIERVRGFVRELRAIYPASKRGAELRRRFIGEPEQQQKTTGR